MVLWYERNLLGFENYLIAILDPSVQRFTTVSEPAYWAVIHPSQVDYPFLFLITGREYYKNIVGVADLGRSAVNFPDPGITFRHYQQFKLNRGRDDRLADTDSFSSFLVLLV